MSLPTLHAPTGDLLLVKLARELAIEQKPLPDVLRQLNLTEEDWEDIKENERFNSLLASEVEAWHSALNTHERVKLKAATMMEEWLPESYARLHDSKETLSAKTELAKLVARLAGMGLTNASIEGGSAEKFSVTINLGGDNNIRLEKDITPRVIEDSQ